MQRTNRQFSLPTVFHNINKKAYDYFLYLYCEECSSQLFQFISSTPFLLSCCTTRDALRYREFYITVYSLM